MAAVVSGAALVFLALGAVPHSAMGFLAGIVVGLIYANGFEYVLHRHYLHSGRGILAVRHMVHHGALKTPEAALYVNLTSNFWGVVALILGNALPFWILQREFRHGWVAGAFASFALYYVAFEEIHWRMHMGGWLPMRLLPAAKHHLLHHAEDTHRFNVFLPLFDWLFRSAPPGCISQKQSVHN